jgi:hypothetical protein
MEFLPIILSKLIVLVKEEIMSRLSGRYSTFKMENFSFPRTV